MRIATLYCSAVILLAGCKKETLDNKKSNTPPVKPSPPKPNQADILPVIKKYNEVFEEVKKEVPHFWRLGETCPPKKMYIEDIGEEIIIESTASFSGSGTELFKAVRASKSGGDTEFLVKVLTLKDASLAKSFANEIAVMDAVNGQRNLQRRFKVDLGKTPQISATCATRLYVTEYLGGSTAADMMITSKKELFDLAANTLQALSDMHALKFSHGDVYAKNFVMKSSVDSKGARIIDYGRSKPILDHKTGKHISNAKVPVDLTLNPYLLSKWELMGETTTLRDDLYRLAEIWVRVAGGDDEVNNMYMALMFGLCDNKDILNVKNNRKWRSDPRIPPIIVDFYETVIRLDFEQTIEYQRWINVFRENAK